MAKVAKSAEPTMTRDLTPERTSCPHCRGFRTGVSWFEAKWGIVLEAVRAYLSNPRYRLPSAATA